MTRRKLQLWLCAALALAVGLALRLWFVAHTARIDGDALLYGGIAKNWLEHGVYAFTETAHVPQPTLIRLPGYPLFLVACFRVFGIEHYTAVMYVQTVLDLVTCVLASLLAGRLFGTRGAMATLWLAAICPFTASYVSAPLTETLSLLCIALTFYGLERWRAAGMGWSRWLWVMAAAMSYAILLRPEQGLLAAAVFPAMLWMVWRPLAQYSQRGRSVWPVLAAAVLVVLPLAPWAVRNWRVFHVIQPLAPRSATDPGEFVPVGFQRWYRTWAIDYASTEDVYWNYDGDAVEINDIPSRAFDSEEQYVRTDALLKQYNETDNATPAFDAEFAALARERIEDDPLRYYIAMPVARFLDMFLRPRTEMLPLSIDWWRWSEHPQETKFAIGYAALNLAYFVLGGVGFWVWRRRGWNGMPVLAWSMMGYALLRCVVLLTLDNSEPRYTLEFFPLILVWAAVLFSRPRDVSKYSEAP
jgi:hypothetical protein